MQTAFECVSMSGNFSPISQTDLAQRRQKLRRQRRVRVIQAAWRMLAVAGLAGGLVWVSTHPVWLIRNANQIKVEGNQFLPTPMIRSLLPIPYPQSLLRVEPQAIARELKNKAPIADVIVSRQLFPPSLVVRVRERYPVAMTLTSPADIQLLNQRPTQGQNFSSRVGFLDENGFAIAAHNFLLVEGAVKLPTLKVIGDSQQYRPYWSTLYREISRSPVKITEIDFQNPANLVLKTELGKVHVGPYSVRLSDQLKTLDRMRKLPNQISLSQIAYIDLRNPASPVVQVVGTKESTTADVP
ncbi:MAG: FtsQ-type POTRA domain-containing protein [Leptolyngbyaceae cyanobacterium bins.349]|nr:FtsQ-type POTRA domain-containing protein [Leptolyngbyaceae cyanobacterium bins.349]